MQHSHSFRLHCQDVLFYVLRRACLLVSFNPTDFEVGWSLAPGDWAVICCACLAPGEISSRASWWYRIIVGVAAFHETNNRLHRAASGMEFLFCLQRVLLRCCEFTACTAQVHACVSMLAGPCVHYAGQLSLNLLRYLGARFFIYSY